MIKNNIRALRTRQGLTQQQLAAAAGTSQQQVQRIEAGVQAARVDLANRFASALGASLNDIFPDLARLKDLASAEKREEDRVAEAGIELDPCLHTFSVTLRSGLARDFFVSAREKTRLRQIALDSDRSQFAVFDTPTERVAVNMREASVCQFLFDPLFGAGLEDEGADESEALKVWLVQGGEPLSFQVDCDREPDCPEEPTNLNNIFFELDAFDGGEPIAFIDEDGEEVILLPAHIALCTVPLAFVTPALLDAQMEGEEENAD